MATFFPRLKSKNILYASLTVLTTYLILFSKTLLAVEPISVEGNQVLIGGERKSLAGVSLFWSNTGWGGEKFYTKDTISWLHSQWNTQIIRAAMGVEANGAYLADPVNNKNRVLTVINESINHGMYVIVDWHSHQAENHQEAAIEFFSDIAQKFGHYDNIIYEIYNEPLEVSWSQTIKPYAVEVIKAIRQYDEDNLIIVGTPRWSQDVDIASNDPITGFENIAYTLHFYAASHKESLRQKARTALSNGIALFVTEWGTVDYDGDGAVDLASTDQWMAFLRENNISHLNWAFNDKLEGASILKPSDIMPYPLSESQLTQSGEKVKSIITTWDLSPTATPIVSPPPINSPSPAPESNNSGGGSISIFMLFALFSMLFIRKINYVLK